MGKKYNQRNTTSTLMFHVGVFSNYIQLLDNLYDRTFIKYVRQKMQFRKGEWPPLGHPLSDQ